MLNIAHKRVNTARLVAELIGILEKSNIITESEDSADVVVKVDSISSMTEALVQIPSRSTVIIEITEENLSVDEVARHLLDNSISSKFELIIREQL